MENIIHITHNDENVTISIDDDVCVATTDDGDVFFHFELADESVDAKSEIIDEFGENVYNELMGL